MMRKPNDKRTVSLHVLCSPAEYSTLVAAAKAAHLPLGAWVRSTMLKIAAAGAVLLAIGCGRALPEPNGIDATIMADSDVAADSAIESLDAARVDFQQNATDALPDFYDTECATAPCRQAAPPIICCAAPGDGCPAGFCRTHTL